MSEVKTPNEDGTAMVVFTPSGKRGRFPLGTPVLVAARRLGVDIDSVCGGRGICGRCQIAPAFGSFPKHGLESRVEAVSEWNKVEARYRSKRELADGRRLGCQALIEGDLVIDVPPESQVHKQVVRKSADERAVELAPSVQAYRVTIAAPQMDEPSGDVQRLYTALAQDCGLGDLSIALSALQKLQRALRRGAEWRVSALVRHGARGARIIDVFEDSAPAVFGVAVDLGSTTIAAHLINLADGGTAGSAGVMNPQIRFGEDLMSRVSYAMMNEGGAQEMTAAVRESLDSVLGELAEQAQIARTQIVDMVIVGNPVMHHLLLGVDPVELGGAPFALAASDALELSAAELSLATHPEAGAYILPCIAGHVGADAAAVVLAEKPYLADEITLIVDVGTNAEIILGDQARLTACSSPTGPAFEGAQISAGQRAAPGAIERVRIDPRTLEPRFRVIGSDLWSDEPGFEAAAAQLGVSGICGSGIIEAIAEMRLAGVIDEDGVVRGELAARTPRIVADGRTFTYRLRDAGAEGPEICVTQADVRAIQLAKAALYAGCRLLMDRRGVDHVDRVLLAGAFGAHISPLHALILGMVPDCDVDKVFAVGNAAGAGARIALLNRSARVEIEEAVRQIEKIETAIEPRFQEHFVNAMALPNKIEPFPKLAEIASLPRLEAAEGGGGGRRGGRRRRG
ncbi:MAG: ASKHA domain-containing protein [Neomegalonema sp.]|nr:ASKHA domain-containing protein [Neomegalonema sp.]